MSGKNSPQDVRNPKSNWAEANAIDLGASFAGSMREMKLLQARKVFLCEGVDANTARRIISDLLILDSEGNEPIQLYVNSPGGEVNSGFAIFDTIRLLRSEVVVINTGLCASIATIINVAAKKENRLSLPNTRFLIHQPLIMGQIYGQASDIEITAHQILKTRERINNILAAECGQDLKKVEEDTVRDYWMSAHEAVEYGLITRIVKTAKDFQAK